MINNPIWQCFNLVKEIPGNKKFLYKNAIPTRDRYCECKLCNEIIVINIPDFWSAEDKNPFILEYETLENHVKKHGLIDINKIKVLL